MSRGEAEASPRSLTDRASHRMYEGIWAILSGWFRVPRQPPDLPAGSSSQLLALRLGTGWLRLKKTQFWIALLVVDLALIFVWGLLLVNQNTRAVGLWTAPIWIAAIVLPDIVAYIAIHLAYDTTWYVLSDRSMRLRTGAITIREATITYENIQNVKITQGPLQRLFGISSLIVETAGGGGSHGPHAHANAAHTGVMEGLDNAPAVRELIMQRVRASRGAGLGDDAGAPEDAPGRVASFKAWTPRELDELRAVARECRLWHEQRGAL